MSKAQGSLAKPWLRGPRFFFGHEDWLYASYLDRNDDYYFKVGCSNLQLPTKTLARSWNSDHTHLRRTTTLMQWSRCRPLHMSQRKNEIKNTAIDRKNWFLLFVYFNWKSLLSSEKFFSKAILHSKHQYHFTLLFMFRSVYKSIDQVLHKQLANA